MKADRLKGRRRKPGTAAQLRPFRVVIAILTVLAVGGGAFTVSWPGWRPREIDVSGNRIVSREAILSAAGISTSVSMWLQDTGAMTRRVEGIPYVAVAGIHRVPPATIVIGVTERVPFAVVRSGKKEALIDRDLRVLEPVKGNRSEVLLEVSRGEALVPGAFLNEPAAIALRDDYDAMIAAHVIPVSLALDRFGGLVATMRGGVRILLGDDSDLAKKLALVDPILAQVIGKQRRVAAVDLRAPNTPVVVYK